MCVRYLKREVDLQICTLEGMAIVKEQTMPLLKILVSDHVFYIFKIGSKKYIRHLRLNRRKIHIMDVENLNHESKSNIHVKWVIMCLCDSVCVV